MIEGGEVTIQKGKYHFMNLFLLGSKKKIVKIPAVTAPRSFFEFKGVDDKACVVLLDEVRFDNLLNFFDFF